MTKIFIKLILLFSVVLGLNANEIKISPSFKEAIAQGKKENKNVIMYMYGTYCPWCTKMQRDTFSNKEVIKYINDNYIFVKIETQMDEYPAIFKPNGVPTTYLVNSKTGYELLTMKGYKKPSSFLGRLKRQD